jgi:hypothetical protein
MEKIFISLIVSTIGLLSAPHSKTPEQAKQECMHACADRGTAELHRCNQVPECEQFVEHQYDRCMKACLADER